MNDTNKTLSDVFCDVLEKLAFMFAEKVDAGDLATQEGEFALASIRFTGQMAGALEIAVPRDMCAEMAANVLGTEAGDEMSILRGEDTLKEVLNVTCGNFLTTLAGAAAVFDLSIPELTSLSSEGWSDLARDPQTLAFDIEGRPAVLLKLNMAEERQ